MVIPSCVPCQRWKTTFGFMIYYFFFFFLYCFVHSLRVTDSFFFPSCGRCCAVYNYLCAGINNIPYIETRPYYNIIPQLFLYFAYLFCFYIVLLNTWIYREIPGQRRFYSQTDSHIGWRLILTLLSKNNEIKRIQRRRKTIAILCGWPNEIISINFSRT